LPDSWPQGGGVVIAVSRYSVVRYKTINRHPRWVAVSRPMRGSVTVWVGYRLFGFHRGPS
jgi:hypothetical protein